MELVSEEIYKIVIKKKKDNEKTHLLYEEPKKQIIGVIPYYFVKPEIKCEDKKYYLLDNNFILDKNKMFTIEVRDKKEDETTITYKKHIKKEIISFFENQFGYENLKIKNIINIMNIANNNIKIFAININKNKRIYKKMIKSKIDNIFRLLIYFNNPNLEEDVEFLEDILSLEENDYVLDKYISLEESKTKIMDLKVRKIIEKLIEDLN